MDTNKISCCKIISEAATKGHIKCLNSFNGNPSDFLWWDINDIIYDISAQGHYECLEYACEKGHVPFLDAAEIMCIRDYGECLRLYLSKIPGKCFPHMATSITLNSSINCLKVLYELEIEWSKIFYDIPPNYVSGLMDNSMQDFFEKAGEDWYHGIFPTNNIKG